MKIGELAKRCDVAPSTIRFYESRGLLKSIPRKMNGYREYPEDAVALLTIILNAQKTGFSLDEIQQILPPNIAEWNHDTLVASLKKKIADLESLEKQLKKNKAILKGVLTAVEQKPADLACEDNAKRVLKKINKVVKAKKS